MLKNNIFYKTNFKEINTKYPIIIFLHGLIENYTIWNKIYTILSKKYKIILIDLPGHGNSMSPLVGKDIFTMEEMADLIVNNVLKKEKITKAFFIGHSMGGYVALAIAEKYPNYFSSLCLLNSTAESDTIEKKKYRLNLINLIEKDYDSYISKSIKYWFNDNLKDSFKEEKKLLKNIALSMCSKNVISILKGISIRKDRKFIIQNTFFPKLYIYGKYDKMFNKDDIYKESNKGKNTNLVEVNTGHMSHLEIPERIANILKNFIICFNHQL